MDVIAESGSRPLLDCRRPNRTCLAPLLEPSATLEVDEQREQAFDRFWRARSGAGSGLGLAIVRRLVEADGGNVELRPAPDGGLEAVVRFTHATRAARSR